MSIRCSASRVGGLRPALRRGRHAAVWLALALPVVAEAQPPLGPTEAQRWSFSTTFGRFHTDNFLLISPDAPGNTVDNLSVGLLYGRLGQRMSFSGYGRVSVNYYENFSQYNRLNYGGGFGLSYRPSPTASVYVSQAATSGFYTPILIGVGVALPQVRTDVFRNTLLATWHPGPRTTLSISGDFTYLHYTSDVSTLDAAQLPLDVLILAGTIPPEQAEIGIADLPTPVDASLVALAALSAEGVRARQLNLVTYRGGFQAEQKLTDRLSGSVQLGYRGLDYGRPAIVSGGQFDSGASLRLGLGPGTSASLQYTYQQNRAQVPVVSTQTAVLQVEHEMSPRLKVDASFGVGVSNQGGQATSSGTSLLGGGGLSGRHRRTRYSAYYGRSVFQAYGFGRNYLTDYASVLVDQTVTKRLSIGVDGRYRRSRDVFARGFSFDSQIYRITAGYRVQRRTMVGGFYSYRIIDRGAEIPIIKSSAWGFSATYVRAWK